MTRNLIEAKAWTNGRNKICRRCQHLGDPGQGLEEYAWRGCKIDGGIGDAGKWDEGHCRYFTPKQDGVS
jgi:hypothetical protein